VVRLVGRNGNVLRVTGLDALDGSPILDIKPYFRDTPDTDEIKVPDWMRDIHQTFTEEAPSE
jgi:tRNA (Thr-GGU) A37 N-methylase